MIKSTMIAIGLLATLTSVLGCASESTIVEASVEAAPSQEFSQNQAEVVAATQRVLLAQGLKIKEITELDGITTIIFSKPVSAFSWGEVGKITVSDSPSGSTVTLISQKRSAMSVFGTTQATFATRIFAGIAESF